MSTVRILSVSLGAAALFGAGWWTGRALQRPAVVAPGPAAAQSSLSGPATAALSLADAVAQFAGANGTLTPRELRARLAQASPAEIPGLLELVAKLPSRLDRDRCRATLLGRWVKLDPTAARAWAEARPVLDDRHSALRDVFSAWSEQDPATVAALITSDNVPGGFETLDDVLAAWLANDPVRARAWVGGITHPRLRDLALQALVAVLARDNPSAALETALAASTEPGGRNSLTTAVRAAVLRDPSSASTILDRIASAEAHGWAAVQIVDVLAASDPKLAGEFTLTLPSGPGRAHALATAIRAMATDPDDAYRWVSTSLPAGAERDRAIAGLVGQIAEAAPQDALRFLDRLPPETRPVVLEEALSRLVYADAAGATGYVRLLPPGPERDRAAESLLTLQCQSDPAGALATLQRDFPELQSDRLYERLVANSLYTSANELLALLPLLPTEPARNRFLDAALKRFAFTAPETAADLLLALPPAQRSAATISQVAKAWAGTTPAAAAAWAASLPDDSARQAACHAVLSGWAATDPSAALRWAGTLPDPQLRADAARLVTEGWASSDPISAARWSQGIVDPAARRSAQATIAARWLHYDIPAATKWLAETDLPADRKAALLTEAHR